MTNSAASPEACETRICPSPVGSRIIPSAAPASSRTCSAATVSATWASSVESSAVVTADAPAIHRSRRRPASYSREFSIATPAAAASACTTCSSSGVNAPPPFFSVR